MMIRGAHLLVILCSIAICLALYSAAIAFFFFQTCLPSSLRLSKFLLSSSPAPHNASSPPFIDPAPLASSGNACSPGSLSSSGNCSPALLKVFMYDVPRKFTYGVIEAYLLSRSPSADLQPQSLDDSQLRYPGNQHSAEWWLFLDLLKPQHDRTTSPSVRVTRPEDADVFFAPFFSSLSLNVRTPGSNLTTPRMNYSDEQTQMDFVEWLEQQPTWHANRGKDHVIVCQDPNALHLVIDRLKNSILLVSDFGRLAPEQGSWWKDVVLPYSHRIASYVHENVTLERNTLLFFMGNRYRKEGGKVRDELFKVLENEDGMVIQHGLQSREGRRLAARGMRTAKFCLHPAGDTPSACRLFDAIVSLCVPVVVSDDIELPFEDELDYSSFAIFVPSHKAVEPGYLAKFLWQVSDDRLREYQQELRKVRRYFEYEESNGAVDQIWRAIATKLPRVRTMIHRDRRAVAEERTLLA